MVQAADDMAFVNPEPPGSGGPGRIRPLRLLPGGAEAVPEEAYAAAIILGSLGVLWAIRRNLGQESSHVHVGGSGALVFLFYYLIVTAIVRLAAGNLAERGDTPFARAVAFFA